MNKIIKLIVTLTLLIFSFFIGVKYSDSIKNHASWLFEAKEEEVELPDLSKENINNTTVDESGENLEEPATTNEAAPQDSAPMDNLENEKK
jgi:hypothetical protein